MQQSLLQNLDQIEEALTREGMDAPVYGEVLARLRKFCERYAALERKLIGDVPVPFPTYLLGLELPKDPLAAGEAVARRERERITPGKVEAGDVATLLDREGFKVYRPVLPDAGDLEGLFLFDAAVGPVFLVDGGLPAAEATFVLARLYAHFLIDNDPYRIRLVRRGDGAAADAVQMRSRSFAGALLVSREGLEEFLNAVGHPAGAPVTRNIVRQLLVYFEVGSRILLERLLALGHLRASDIPTLLAALETGDPADPGPGSPAPAETPSAIPERFLRLALEAHAREELSLARLATHLETDVPTARALAARFRIEEGETIDPMRLMAAATEATFQENEARVDLGDLEDSGSDHGAQADADDPEEEIEH